MKICPAGWGTPHPANYSFMLDVKEKILEAYAGTEKLRRDLINGATDQYFVSLGAGSSPTQAELDVAQAAARSLLRRELLSPASVSLVSGGSVTDERSTASVALIFDSIVRELLIPEPARHSAPKAYRLAVSAMIGAILGMVILTPLFRLAFEMRDVGLALGGPLGALLAVLIVHRLSRSSILLKLFGRVFGMAQRLPGYDRRSHERVVRTSIEQWLGLAISLLAALCSWRTRSQDTPADKESAFRKIAGLIYALHQTAPESLSVAADELIQQARNCGFEGLEGSPAFSSAPAGEQSVIAWTSDLLNKYEPFGHVAEGDKVRIERRPVVFDGEVMERGLVRKLRDKQ
ncbi:MAG: hypothetical protein ISS70_13755 [Phycisphaerae bacterium]|nr:hypothetical protein [Phycisphaerae bacterium]